jgi:dihydropyrimidinase
LNNSSLQAVRDTPAGTTARSSSSSAAAAAGKEIQGKVTVTISRGRVVWYEGKLDVESGSGRFVPLPTHGPLFDGIDKAGADTAARLAKAFAADNGATPVVRAADGSKSKAGKDEL